jgi:hypothetical protein
MKYFEIIEACDPENQRVDAQKQHAKQMMKNAKIATEKAEAADLHRKQKNTQDALAKINQKK